MLQTHYYAPLYYDLARFVDTAKVFAILKNPWLYMSSITRINQALRSFLDGYDKNLDMVTLKKMQKVHQREHIETKRNHSLIDALALKFLYMLIRV